MHHTTALVLLRHLAREGLLDVKVTTFMVPRYPQPVHLDDVKGAFVALADFMRFPETAVKVTRIFGIELRVPDRLFEKLFHVVFVQEKLFPPMRHEGHVHGSPAPLPTLFVNSEKTQFRQIPLAEQRPWPFHFLLELGGMVVVRAPNYRDMLLELRQFLNNHPQFEVKVHAKERPDGTVAIFTYWFRELPRTHRRKNLNVPQKQAT